MPAAALSTAQRALSTAASFKLDLQKILDAANEDGITDIMKAHVRFADTLGLKATPSYLIDDVAIQGHPGRKSLKGVIELAFANAARLFADGAYPPDLHTHDDPPYRGHLGTGDL